MDDLLWLGCDLGTSGVRAVLVDSEGTVVGSGSAPIQRHFRYAPRHEQDPEEWWTALCAATRAATAELRGRTIGAMAVDGTSGTLLVQDAQGRPRGAALMYDDARAAAETERVQEVGAEVWDKLGYRMQPSWALPKALWLVEHGDLQPGDTLVHQVDTVAARLTGGPVATDSSNALKTGYDAVDLSWPYDVLDALGLDVARLPDVVLPGTVIGVVSAEASVASGIPAGTAIRAGMTDGCAAQIAARALAPGAWSSALGTTLVVKGATTELLRDPTGAVYSHRNPDGGWLPGGASSIGAGVIGRDFAGADLDALTAQAAALDPAPGVSYPLAGRGERFPFVAPDAVAFAVGVGADPVSRFASTLQGIALVERLSYDVLAGLGADVSGPVTISGGATRNGWWNQLRADILGRTVLRPDSVEAALGMAVLAAAPRGRLAETAERMVRIADTYQPDLVRGERYAAPYQRLCDELVARGWLTPR